MPGLECFEKLTPPQEEDYFQFERSMCYANSLVILLGIVGNVLAVIVLLSKDMRKNCFSQLLTGQ